MHFKQRYNCYFREVPEHRDGTIIEVFPDTFVPWLGTVDRHVARTLPGAREVSLDLTAWRLKLTDAWQWLEPDRVIVGCLVEQGVLAVTDYQKPLLKRRPGA